MDTYEKIGQAGTVSYVCNKYKPDDKAPLAGLTEVERTLTKRLIVLQISKDPHWCTLVKVWIRKRKESSYLAHVFWRGRIRELLLTPQVG